MAENDNEKTKPQEPGTNAPEEPALPRPVKTPMYQAMHAERYMRQAKIKQIQPAGTRLLCYVAGPMAPITRDDVVGIIELLHNVPRHTNVDFLLHTGGGDIDAAEKITSMLRTTVGKGRFRVIVPDFAKSAGTLIALAADKIIMSDSSELGPIDPQFPKKDGDGNARWLSVLNYLEAYKTQSEKLRKDPGDVPAQIMLSKLDPTMVVQFEAICKRARKLAEEHLTRWMFQTKTANFTKIAQDLMDNERWPSHGQMISWQDAKQMELEVEYLAPEDEVWRSYWSLYCLQRLAVKDRQKLFEADYASLLME